MADKRDDLIIKLVDALDWDVFEESKALATEALKAIGIPDASIKLYFGGEAVLEADPAPKAEPVIWWAMEMLDGGRFIVKSDVMPPIDTDLLSISSMRIIANSFQVVGGPYTEAQAQAWLDRDEWPTPTPARPTSITAAEWHTIAADVEAGRCEVWDFNGDVVKEIVKNGPLFRVVTIDPDLSWSSDDSVELTVRWLDTAPAVDAGAGAGYLDEVTASIEEAYPFDALVDAGAGVDNIPVSALVASLIRERDAALKQLADAQVQVAAAGKMSTAARKDIAELFDPEQRFDRSKDGRFVTETLNFVDGALMCIESIVKGTATPQPSPVNSELVAALKTVYEAVVQCDLQSDMLDAYKAPYDETIHTDHINFDALNEWADLSNALELLREHDDAAAPTGAATESE